MTAIGGITIYSPSSSVDFIGMRCPNGWPIDQRAIEEEELRSMGVDSRRYRDESYQQLPFQMDTLQDYSAYVTAVIIGRQYRFYKGKICRLTTTINGRAYTWNRMHVIDVSPQCLPGTVSGANSLGASGQAFVQATWTLINLDVDVVATN